jgi:hypothetical protein
MFRSTTSTESRYINLPAPLSDVCGLKVGVQCGSLDLSEELDFFARRPLHRPPPSPVSFCA